MPNALGWGAGIAGNVMTETDFAQSAAEMPLSASRVFYERSKIAATESPAVGTIATDNMIDPGRGSPFTDAIARLTPAGDIVAPLVRDLSANAIPNSWRESDADLRARGQEPLTKEQYDSDPVPGVAWDARMTVARRQSMKDYQDWKDFKGRQIARSDHGVANFLGELAGSAVDPVNYIPVLGESMKGAQVARWGLGKTMMMSAADAALNTALAAGATKPYRNSIGDETTWADVASQSAMAALVGGIFGAGSHGISHLLESRKANTLARVSDARAVLNEAVSHIAAGEDVNLSAGAKDILARADQDLSQIEIPPGLFQQDNLFRELHGESGTYDLLHGRDNADEFTGFDPKFAGDRYEGRGGTFGPDGVYLDNTGEWQKPGQYGFGVKRSYRVQLTAKKMLMVTPDTLSLLHKQIGGDLHPKDVLAYAKAHGYDAINVHGFQKIIDDIRNDPRSAAPGPDDPIQDSRRIPWDKLTEGEKAYIEKEVRRRDTNAPHDQIMAEYKRDGASTYDLEQKYYADNKINDYTAQDQVFAFNPEKVKPTGDYKHGDPYAAPQFGKGYRDVKINRGAIEVPPVAGNIRRPRTLLNFLADTGLKDDGGELKAAGLGYLVRKDGLDLDVARERAVEAGYLQDNGGEGASTSTVNDLLDALQRDQQARAAKDNASRVYSTKDEAQKGAFLDREKAAQSADEFDAKHGSFVEQAKAEGYDEHTTGDQSLMAMASDMHAAGKSLDDAIESAARQLEDWGPDPAAHLSDADLHAFTGYDPARAPRLDTTLPPDDFGHDAESTTAAQSATKPSTIESMAKDYGIDTADMHLDYEIKQLEAEGRLSAGDTLGLEAAKSTVERANAWGEALRAAATCVLGG